MRRKWKRCAAPPKNARTTRRRKLPSAPRCPHSVPATHSLGHVHAQQGRLAQAETAYRRALELDPDFAPAHHRLGDLLARLGRNAEAEAEYRRAVELAPDDLHVLAGVAAGLHLLKKYSQAIKVYRKVLALEPEAGYAHGGLAGAYRHEGEHRRFLTHLQKARDLITPDDTFAQACLASIGGQTDLAFELLDRYLAGNPSNGLYNLSSTAVFDPSKRCGTSGLPPTADLHWRPSPRYCYPTKTSRKNAAWITPRASRTGVRKSWPNTSATWRPAATSPARVCGSNRAKSPSNTSSV
ncbi:MAG: tetratricopeptide repeat protein [Chloroflexi bacterium]|nr:tetratricopeptide repeat protein [Chloroflexota bacterium]